MFCLNGGGSMCKLCSHGYVWSHLCSDVGGVGIYFNNLVRLFSELSFWVWNVLMCLSRYPFVLNILSLHCVQKCKLCSFHFDKGILLRSLGWLYRRWSFKRLSDGKKDLHPSNRHLILINGVVLMIGLT